MAGKYSVFGHVIHGKSIIREIERVKTNKDDVPESNVVIDQCGVWTDDMPVPIFNASYDTIGGIYMKNTLKMIIQISTKNPLKKHLVWHQNQRKWYFAI